MATKTLPELVREYFAIKDNVEERLMSGRKYPDDGKVIEKLTEVTDAMRAAAGLDHEPECEHCQRRMYCEGGCDERTAHLCEICWPDPDERADREYHEAVDRALVGQV